ncbi:GAF domain-containing protein [Halobaculum sp. MBLA0147]|uniref:PAS domain-containing sensor histidine kinase n=1 Tax=Halobaculum sp. MBLA0147 TaxID=3079934 RepID=UPI0035235B50
MSSREQQVQILYEISLAIGRGGSVEAVAREALSAYVRKLNCSAGAVFELTDDAVSGQVLNRITAIPSQPGVNEAFQTANQRLSDLVVNGQIDDALPVRSSIDVGATAHIMKLPQFGVLLLVNSSGEIPADVLAALGELNKKLADACQAERVESALRTQKTRFETLLETIPEPMVSVAQQQGQQVVRTINTAFERVFGCNEADVIGQPLDELLVDPNGGTPDVSWTTSGGPEKRDVERQTVDGPRIFSLRSASVSPQTDGTERFGLYVDVTEQRKREKTLEQLYQAAGDILTTTDRTAVCNRAVQVATDILDFSTVGIHLYDRDREGLAPVATTGTDNVLSDKPPVYTDRETVVWEVYESGETSVINDIADVDYRLPDPDTPVESALVLPLGDEGVMIASSQVPNAFDGSDRQFGNLLARMVHIALNRERREQSYALIQEAAREMITAEDATGVANRLVERTAMTISGPFVGVWRHDPGGEGLVPIAWTDESAEALGQIPTFGPDESIAWEVFQDGTPRRVRDVQAETGGVDPDGLIESELLIPIDDYGLLAVGSKHPRDFTQTEFEFVRTLGATAESALRIINQQQELDMLDEVLARVLRHNVRNELNVIRGRASLIQEAGSSELSSHADEIVSAADRIISTADHASEIREVVNQRREKATLQLDRIVSRVVSSLTETHPGADISLGDIPPVEVSVHPQFELAIRHAIENGVQHQSGSRPHVEIDARHSAGHLTIEVRDDGPGIPESELEPLVAGEETQVVHGSGAGLWIIDRVVDYSNGVVDFDMSDSGTTVRITLGRAAISGKTLESPT